MIFTFKNSTDWLSLIKQAKNQSKYLYHSTTVDSLKKQISDVIWPETGELVRSTEAFQELEEQPIRDTLFLSDKPNWIVFIVSRKLGHKPNLEELQTYGAVVVVELNETIWNLPEDHHQTGTVENYLGEQQKYEMTDLYDHDDPSTHSLPPYIESNDFFTFKEQDVVQIATGKQLIQLLQNVCPEELQKLA